MWLSIFRYIQITTVSTVFRCFKMFQHFWVARDLFALPLPLALLCLFSADYSHLHPSRELLHRTCNPRAKARQLQCGGGPATRPTQPPDRASTWACDVILAPIIMKDLRHSGVIPHVPAAFLGISSTQLTWCGPCPLYLASSFCLWPTYLHIHSMWLDKYYTYLCPYISLPIWTVNRVDTEPGLAWPSYVARRTSSHVLHDLAYWWRVQSVPKRSEQTDEVSWKQSEKLCSI